MERIVSVLTRREKQVVRALAQGLTMEETAQAMGISPRTVKSHIARLLYKLYARNRTHAVVRALQSGQLDLSQC